MDSSRYDPLVVWSLFLVATLISGGIFMTGCGSTDPVEGSRTAADTVATAQDVDDGPTRQEKGEQYSTYYENYKNDEYSAARHSLLWVLEQAPAYPKGDDRNYRRVVKLYEGLAGQSPDPSVKAAYLDTAATYLSTARQEMSRLGISFGRYKWELRRGRFMERHQDDLSETTALGSPTSHYQSAFQLAPEKVDSYYIRRILESYLEADTVEGALDFADAASRARGDDPKVAKLAELVRKRVFARKPQVQLDRLQAKIERHPDSTQLLEELFTAHRRSDNPSEASQIADRLMKQKPSGETIREIAEMRLENGENEAALAAYDRAAQRGAELKYQDYFNRGTAYQQVGQPAKARREYRSALKMNESFGQAYLAIGDLYARAVNQCSGEKMGRQDRAVYWVAVDQYQQAKSVDPSVLEVATQRIATYTEVFPTRQDIFYRTEWELGKSFPIDYGCYSWIRETTTVRAASSSD